ncbi:MAG: cytochrome c biogenesis protein CcsA, partial [Planctomycetota bacterium]|nr:cytochrome c biogenesis protein CcsA [Planctomycetota bacterium]
WLLPVIGVHAAVLVLRGVHLGRPPTEAHEILSVVALAIAAVYTVVEFASRDRRSGAFVILLAFLFQYTSTVFLAAPGAATASEAAESVWARLHIVPALVAYTAFGFACIYGLLYLLARRGLRHHRFGVLFDRLPPLDLLGRMMWLALVAGFIFMTFTIITGALMALASHGAVESAAPSPKIISKIVTGGVAWIIYAIAILGRLVGKWQPGRISVVAVAGYAIIVALLVASALLS